MVFDVQNLYSLQQALDKVSMTLYLFLSAAIFPLKKLWGCWRGQVIALLDTPQRQRTNEMYRCGLQFDSRSLSCLLRGPLVLKLLKLLKLSPPMQNWSRKYHQVREL